MKNGKYLLAATAALLASTQANAAELVTGQISVGGYAAPVGSPTWIGATGYDAVANGNGAPLSPGVAGGLTSYGAGTGSFAGLACASVTGGCGTVADILNFATFSPIANFLTLNTNGIAFDLSALTGVSENATLGSITVNGTGTIRFSGYENTPGMFSLTAQGGQITSFSASVMSNAVPEPGTWAMMLLGFGAIGFAMRRRRQPALLQLA